MNCRVNKNHFYLKKGFFSLNESSGSKMVIWGHQKLNVGSDARQVCGLSGFRQTAFQNHSSRQSGLEYICDKICSGFFLSLTIFMRIEDVNMGFLWYFVDEGQIGSDGISCIHYYTYINNALSTFSEWDHFRVTASPHGW